MQKTTSKWVETADSLGIPSLEFEKTAAWVSAHCDYTASGDSYAYGIFAEGCASASAVVDIVYSRRAGPDLGWLKMLELTMGPEYSQSQINTADTLLQIIRIYVTAILGTIALTDTHKARVIKLFGRNDQLMTMLASVHLHLCAEAESSSDGKVLLTSKIEGRWLVISVS